MKFESNLKDPKSSGFIRLHLILSFSRFIINKNIKFNNKNYDRMRFCFGKRKNSVTEYFLLGNSADLWYNNNKEYRLKT